MTHEFEKHTRQRVESASYCSRHVTDISTVTVIGIFSSSVRLVPNTQPERWEFGANSLSTKQNTKHVQVRADIGRFLQGGRDHPENPQDNTSVPILEVRIPRSGEVMMCPR